MLDVEPGTWAVILGASSGFGGATALELARRGYNIFGIHFDRKATQCNADRIQEEIRALSREAEFFNLNAADDEKRDFVMLRITARTGQGQWGSKVRVLFHSLAFGSMGNLVTESADQTLLDRKKIEMTLDVMGNSLVYWTHGLVQRKLMGRGGRIFAMTSAGTSRVWTGYGAVSAAKCLLESHIRNIAVELAPFGLTANAIEAGVTDTPALHHVPGYEAMLSRAKETHPSGRVTTPEDVALTVAALSRPETQWMTGNVIRVDGGERLTS